MIVTISEKWNQLKCSFARGKTETIALADPVSVCTIINRSLANAVVLNSQKNFWEQSPENHDLKTFSNELIKTIGVINTSVKCNEWAAKNVNVTVVEGGHRPIIGRDLSSVWTFAHTN